MSRKHNQRTRAEILAKREQPIKAWAGWLVLGGSPTVITTRSVTSRSKYMPHFGAKQEAKLRRQRETQELRQAA
jgi:hypothetical protein